MKARAKFAARWLIIIVGLLLLVGIVAPFLSGDSFAPRIRAALETVLSRKVDLGAVHFSLFTGPGFSVDNVVIHENPAYGIEPVAYVGSLEAVPRLSSLFSGHLEFASIRLDDASINLSKTGGPAEPGRWNFEALLSPALIRAVPELHVRSGRINFKFGDTKSVFYLTNTDLDISPPLRGSSAWLLEFSGQPARTDRPAHGFGDFMASGRWNPAGGGRLDLNVRLEQSAAGEMIALVRGDNGGMNGNVSARLHLTGPLDNIRLAGSMVLQGFHRWDLMPPYGRDWPFSLSGRLNLPAQTLDLESRSAGSQALPLSVQFRCANYLSQPRWGAAINWNRFPIAPLLDVARNMGVALPPMLRMTGTLDGVLGYSGQGSLQGEMVFHDASIAIPDSPPLRAAQAQLIFDRGHARLTPATVLTAQNEEAQLQGDYDWSAQSLDLTVSTEGMHVESLRAQVALAAVPWLDRVRSGSWNGRLRYQLSPSAESGWTGRLELHDGQIALPGLAEPLAVESAVAHIAGPWVTLDRIRAQAGAVVIQGEYQFVPQLPRPHRVRISIAEADAAEIERLLMPALRHSGLLARALSFGRLPAWLAAQHVDATVQIGSLHLGEAEVRRLQAHLIWDGAHVEFADIHAHLNGGSVAGALSVNLRGAEPAYQLEARADGVQWKSGTVDLVSTLQASGTGADLLAHLRASGTFAASGLEMDALPDLETVSGAFDLAWAQPSPRLTFNELHLVSGNETYTGQGSTQPDGRLLILLSSGNKEMHMSGTLAQLSLEDPQAR